MPADGKLQVRDLLRAGRRHEGHAETDVASLIAAVPPGQSVPIVVDRDGKKMRVRVTPTTTDGHRVVGRDPAGSATASRSRSR